MHQYMTFKVTQLIRDDEAEPLWQQVDWRVIGGENNHPRDAALQFIGTGDVSYDTLYVTVGAHPDEYRQPLYWCLSAEYKNVDPAGWFAAQGTRAYWGKSPWPSENPGVQADEEGRVEYEEGEVD